MALKLKSQQTETKTKPVKIYQGNILANNASFKFFNFLKRGTYWSVCCGTYGGYVATRVLS